MSSRSEKRRQARHTDDGPSKLPLIIGAVVLIAVVAVAFTLGGGTSSAAATEPVEVEGLDDMATLVSMAQGVTLGDPDAPAQIIEFGDYQCPGCGQFGTQVKPMIEMNLVQTGKASFVFYDLPLVGLHPHSFLAARTARCAGDQDKYWEYQRTLFQNQSVWSGQQSPMRNFMDYAGELGLDQDTFESCVNSDAHADVVTANARLAYELGVSSTPTVMVTRRGQGAARRLQTSSYAAIEAAVNEIIAASQGGAVDSGMVPAGQEGAGGS